MQQATYLLGAGASHKAIPTLSSFNSSITNFLLRLKNDIKDENTLSILTNNWIPLIQLASQHASIDTFAKKLYLTNDVSSLWKLKIILSAYFIHEQSVEHESEQTAGLKS